MPILTQEELEILKQKTLLDAKKDQRAVKAAQKALAKKNKPKKAKAATPDGQPVRVNTASVRENTYAKPEQIASIVSDKLKWLKEGAIRGKVKSDDDVERRIIEYWQIVSETGEVPQKTDLYMFMQATVKEVSDWRKGKGCSLQRQQMIHQLDMMYNSVRDDMAAQNLIQQIAYIWQSKQWQDYKEPTQTYEVQSLTPLDNLPKLDEVEARYADLLVEDTEA